MADGPRLKGKLLDKLKNADTRSLPGVAYDEPDATQGTFTIRFKSPVDNLPAGHAELEVNVDHVVIQDFARARFRQKGGYGRACFDATMKYIERTNPGKKIYLSVLGENDNAVSIYREYGFSFLDEKKAAETSGEYHTMIKQP